MFTDAQSTSYKSNVVFENNAVKFSVTKIVALLQDIAKLKQEHFICFSLNSSGEIIARHTVFIGTLTGSLAHPREIFACAIADHAAMIVVAHNHPSGNPEPSDADKETTQKLAAAGQIMGIPLREHIIVAENGYYSFLSDGLLLWGSLFLGGLEASNKGLFTP